jgi:hypothetical protein
MPQNDPNNWFKFFKALFGPLADAPVWIYTLSLWATAAGVRKRRNRENPPGKWEVLVLIGINYPAGAVAYYVTTSAGVSEWLVIFVTVYVAHQGLHFLEKVEEWTLWALERVGKWKG